MKRTLLITAMACLAGILWAQEQKEVVTGPAFANDAYYSLENGTVDTVANNDWDLALTTSLLKASISANHLAGVEVYTYSKGDTSSWASVDTTGMVWQPMYNSTETLLDGGAFVANSTGEIDFVNGFVDNGWGVYYFATNNVIGDSILIVKTRAGEYLKLLVTAKYATNTWDFKYAELDGSNEQTVTLNANDYKAKNFVYYSLDTDEVIDREPASADWDLLFTQYIEMISMGPGTTVPYPVSGILSNEVHIKVLEARESGMDQATFVDYADTSYNSFSNNVSTIGYDWKKFNGESYTLIDTLAYFIKKYTTIEDEKDSVYFKLYFTGFTGSSEGKYTFMQEMLSVVSNRAPERMNLLQVYPNPASDRLNLVYDYRGNVRVQVIDLMGRSLYSAITRANGLSQLTVDLSGMEPGLMFLKVDNGTGAEVVRFIKQ